MQTQPRHKYEARDGSLHDTVEQAENANWKLERVTEIMLPLGDRHPDVEDHKGWVQHNLETVNRVKDRILDFCRELGYHEHYPVFKNPGRDCHPFSMVGRILNDAGGCLDSAWGRISCIDVQGREHQQPYFAYTKGPDSRHYCVEDRSEIRTS